MGCAASTRTSSDEYVKPGSINATNTTAFVGLLGSKLLSTSGEVNTAEALAGKAGVAIYFSAHWCPPCRGFTPKLAEAYKKELKAKNFEIVFVSSDQDASAFKSYYKSMPWLAVPYTARKIKEALSSRFSISGIPSLVVLNAEGKLVSKDGRSLVMKDPSGQSWVPKAPAAKAVNAPAKLAGVASISTAMGTNGGLSAVLGEEPVLDTDGESMVGLSSIVGPSTPLIALYFSAHWCGPCRAFTPKLVTFVEMLEEEGVRLPIIFGSSDSDKASFDEYFKSMPWFAFPHGDARIDALKKKYSVSGIPWLVVLDSAGNLVMNEADEIVPQGPQAYQTWLKAATNAAKEAISPTAGAPAA